MACAQAQGYCGRPVKYTGMVDVMQKAFRREGVRGLYKVRQQRRGSCSISAVSGRLPSAASLCSLNPGQSGGCIRSCGSCQQGSTLMQMCLHLAS